MRRMVLSVGLSDPFLQSVRTVAPNSSLISVRSIHWCEATSNFLGLAVGAPDSSYIPTAQVANSLEAEKRKGRLQIRFLGVPIDDVWRIRRACPRLQRKRRTSWVKWEPAVSREISIATRTGPLSTTLILAGPLTWPFGAACSWSQSMFQAGHCLGLS